MIYFELFPCYYLDSDKEEPSKLSLSERIKLFNKRIVEELKPQKREVPRRRCTRFQTQPVTSEEVETAKFVGPDLEDSSCSAAIGVTLTYVFFNRITLLTFLLFNGLF